MSRIEASIKPSFTRKPLRELSNNHSSFGIEVSKSKMVKKVATQSSTEIEVAKENDDDCCLDRLLVVHSDLSLLTRQIDDLVARAFKLKSSAGEDGQREIESFSHFLSDTLSSIKPWVSRFEKALATPTLEMEKKQIEETPAVKKPTSAVNEEISEIGSPERTEMDDTLISPSPLVSWRADCNIDRSRSRQLFHLTPLPMSKTMSLKRPEIPARRVLEDMVSDSETEPTPFLDISGDDVNDDLLQDMKNMNQPPSSDENESGLVFSTPMTATSKKAHSLMVMTPCLKMSPPRSCFLLEPISEEVRKVNCCTRKSTPYPVGIHSQISEPESSRSDEGYEDYLGVRYPELLGIQLGSKSSFRGSKDLESSPEWSFSPPKTCLLLQPSDENSIVDVPAIDHNQVQTSLDQGDPSFRPFCYIFSNSFFHDCKQLENSFTCETDPKGSIFEQPVSTPATWRGAGGNQRHHPGENTLKRELWTKFEAVTTTCGGFGTKASTAIASTKGFLDMLDEASCEEEQTRVDQT
ncbi:hypothetical protein LINPERHAP2_LOCUS23609 [Linum perenne]